MRRTNLKRVIAKQEKWIRKVTAQPMACPRCQAKVSLDQAEHLEGDLYRCPECGGTIEHVVPLFDQSVIWCWAMPATRAKHQPTEGEKT